MSSSRPKRRRVRTDRLGDYVQSTGYEDTAATLGDGINVLPSNVPEFGQGLFATRDFHVDDVITKFEGEYVPFDPEKTERGRLIGYTEGEVFKAVRNPTKHGGVYANDATGTDFETNAKIYKKGHEYFLHATSFIPAGSEIFCEYGSDYFSNKKKLGSTPLRPDQAGGGAAGSYTDDDRTDTDDDRTDTDDDRALEQSRRRYTKKRIYTGDEF